MLVQCSRIRVSDEVCQHDRGRELCGHRVCTACFSCGKVFWAYNPSNKFAGLICLEGIETGGVSIIDLSGTAGTGTDVSMFCSVVLAPGNGELVVFCNTKTFFASKEPKNPDSWEKYATKLTQYSLQYCTQFVANGYVCICFAVGDSGVASVPICAAPEISIPGCYTYVKAN